MTKRTVSKLEQNLYRRHLALYTDQHNFFQIQIFGNTNIFQVDFLFSVGLTIVTVMMGTVASNTGGEIVTSVSRYIGYPKSLKV